jgi:hypothetical protein
MPASSGTRMAAQEVDRAFTWHGRSDTRSSRLLWVIAICIGVGAFAFHIAHTSAPPARSYADAAQNKLATQATGVAEPVETSVAADPVPRLDASPAESGNSAPDSIVVRLAAADSASSPPQRHHAKPRHHLRHRGIAVKRAARKPAVAKLRNSVPTSTSRVDTYRSYSDLRSALLR